TKVNPSLVTSDVGSSRESNFAHNNDNLVRLQNRLKAEGYFHGDPTGVLDEQTRIALALYQVDHDLTVTGKLDAPTARALDASPPTPTPTPTTNNLLTAPNPPTAKPTLNPAPSVIPDEQTRIAPDRNHADPAHTNPDKT